MDDVPSPSLRRVCLITAVLAALAAAWLYADILDPAHVQWMLPEGDLLQHFLGWHFFRSEPWSWPLGIIHGYGTEIHSSVVFTDSLPLLALPLKLMSSWLPSVFQYQGIVVWLNVVLNATAAAMLLYRLKPNASAAIMVALLMAFIPAATFQGPGGTGHETLMAHWIILFAMYLLLFTRQANYSSCARWCLLLVAASLVHFYLFFMAGVLWGGWWLARTLSFYRIRTGSPAVDLPAPALPLSAWLFYSVAQPLLILLIMWAVGYLDGSNSTGPGGYGFYSAELLAFFNSLSYVHQPTFSAFLPAWRTDIAGQYEGVAYLGLGILLMWGLALAWGLLAWGRRFCAGRGAGDTSRLTWVRAFTPEAWGLGVICAVAFVYALGNPVTFGPWAVPFALPWPDALLGLLRASGRFIWLPMYGITLAAWWLLANKARPKHLAAMVAVLLIVQWIDLSPWHRYLYQKVRAAGDYTLEADARYAAFNTPALQQALTEKSRLHLVPADNIVETLPLAWLAGIHGLDINVAYVARVLPEDIARGVASDKKALDRKNLRPDVIYAMTDDTWKKDICAMVSVRCVTTSVATLAWQKSAQSE